MAKERSLPRMSFKSGRQSGIYLLLGRPNTLEAEPRPRRHRTAVKGTNVWTVNANALSKVVQVLPGLLRFMACLGLPRDIITLTLVSSGPHFTMSTFARQALTFTATRRGLVTAAASTTEPLTHYKITLRRSAISLPESFKATLVTLGIHRRMQTVYHPHTSECAGKILKVKELVEVENVPASAVRTKTEQRLERKARRGYKVVRPALS